MKSLLYIFLFLSFYSNIYSQILRNNDNIVEGEANEYNLCYVKSKPTFRKIYKTDSILYPYSNYRNIESDTIITVVEFKILVLDIYVTKKYYKFLVLLYKAIHNDSLPKSMSLPLINKTINVIIILDKKKNRNIKKFNKLYRKKQLFVITPPLNRRNNILLMNKEHYNYFFLNKFDYFDQLIRIE